jgi:hypothetical protein
MEGLNNIREAYEQVYAQIDERMDPEERALRRAEIADKKSSRMDSKVASKYASSEAQSAQKADKKSKGKHIHGMADSYDVEGDLVDEARKPSQIAKIQKLNALMNARHKENEKARKEMMGTQAHKDMVATVRKQFEETEIEEGKQTFPAKKVAKQMEKARKGSVYGRPVSRDAVPNVSDSEKKETTRFSKMHHASEKAKREKQNAAKASRSSTFYRDTHPASPAKMKKANEEFVAERELDPTETSEKERLVKGLKKSASDFKKRYGERAKSVMYATATKMAKDRMDTSKSDRRYSVEG